MDEKKYLKWYNKIGYGSGDSAANLVCGLVTTFVMIYLTDTINLNAGVVGTLIMFSKFFDGFTDIVFGKILDNTHTKMGKARPWMLCSYLGNAICLIAIFSIPTSLGKTAQYVWFFIAYTLLNAVFYTANNIAYASLTAMITKNANERVQLGVFRFVFSLATNLLISYATVEIVKALGGGAVGWRTVAIIYAVIGTVINTISALSVKELPEETKDDCIGKIASAEKITFREAFRLLIHNRFFLLICVCLIAAYMSVGITGIGAYYMQYVLGDPALLGTFTAASSLPMIVGLVVTPILEKKLKGLYKLNLYSCALSVVFRALFVIAGIRRNIPFMLITSGFANFFFGPILGSMNALIALAADYTWKKDGKRIDGSMFSCSSLGNKLGSGIGSALSGLLLNVGGYVNAAATQSESAINMLQFMYCAFPLIAYIVILICLYFADIEKAIAALDCK